MFLSSTTLEMVKSEVEISIKSLDFSLDLRLRLQINQVVTKTLWDERLRAICRSLEALGQDFVGGPLRMYDSYLRQNV